MLAGWPNMDIVRFTASWVTIENESKAAKDKYQNWCTAYGVFFRLSWSTKIFSPQQQGMLKFRFHLLHTSASSQRFEQNILNSLLIPNVITAVSSKLLRMTAFTAENAGPFPVSLAFLDTAVSKSRGNCSNSTYSQNKLRMMESQRTADICLSICSYNSDSNIKKQ